MDRGFTVCDDSGVLVFGTSGTSSSFDAMALVSFVLALLQSSFAGPFFAVILGLLAGSDGSSFLTGFTSVVFEIDGRDVDAIGFTSTLCLTAIGFVLYQQTFSSYNSKRTATSSLVILPTSFASLPPPSLSQLRISFHGPHN